MAGTLETQVLNIVAHESTHLWAYVSHGEACLTIQSEEFASVFQSSEEIPFESITRNFDDSQNPSSFAAQCGQYPNAARMTELIVSRQFQLLADLCAPDYDLRFYSLDDEKMDDSGTLFFAKSRFKLELTPDQVLKSHLAARQIETLSERESQVLQMVLQGFTNQAIAINLGLSPKTIEKHRKTMMDKLQVHSVAEVARLAFHAELFDQLVESQDHTHPVPIL